MHFVEWLMIFASAGAVNGLVGFYVGRWYERAQKTRRERLRQQMELEDRSQLANHGE